MHHVRLWKLSTLAMTVLSFALSSMLISRTTPAPQIVYVNQTPQPTQQSATTPTATPNHDQSTSPSTAPSITPADNIADSQLAEAWRARGDFISAGTNWEQSLATTVQAAGHGPIQEPLTRSSLLGVQSQATMQRWLKEQL
jgi:hypothetical protein